MGTKRFRQSVEIIACKTVRVSQPKNSNFLNANGDVEFDYAIAA